ncbi:cation:proton antiporter domain-containing protein [Brevundimonas abyssalis]|uniref:TrkA-N:Sodium/hydrogen exchanger n=1 Tax=Brevundimonas abyssalis TAR-001 TaxID=1391729 RepID=A0A8E0KJC0_9CAUL|nr:trkA-N:Sodium/hydrogen exchanger [Brevundimonas abyssalis TAR-001]
MPHADSLIITLVGGFVLAFVFGMIANRLRLSPLVGYLLAGVLIGPFTPGYVADMELAPQLAEIGVILLMFGVGLHFSPRDLMKVRKVAVPGAWPRFRRLRCWAGRWDDCWAWATARPCCWASPCRWPPPWCSCGRWRSASRSRPRSGAWPSAG